MLRGGAAIEGGGGGKDVYSNNFIIYHHFVQCPPKIARNDHYLWLSDSFFSNNRYFWLLEISKILTTRTSGYQKLETF